MQNVLVTGGAGYIGSILARALLESGSRVRILDNLLFGGESLLGLWGHRGVEILQRSITDAEVLRHAVDGVDAVVHLAGIVGDPACKQEPDLAREVNLEATLRLVKLAASAGVSRFVFASTCSNYGATSLEAWVDEASPLNPVSLYAKTKVECETAILAEEGPHFDPVVLRFATIFGVSPRMRFDLLVNDFTREAVLRKKIVIFGEQFWRPYLHVRDAAEAVVTVLESDPGARRHRIFNVGQDSENFQKRTLAEMVVEQVPGTVVERVRRDEDPRSYRVRFGRFHETFGIPPRVRVEEGIEEVRSLLAHPVLPDPDDPKYTNGGL